MRKFIEVYNQFEGIHCWKDCPHDQVSFLRTPHRHVFHIYTTVKVDHSDRAIEFFMLQNDIHDALAQLYSGSMFDLGSRSCETIAEELFVLLSDGFNYKTIQSIKVSEDNENAAIVKFNE